MFLLKGRGPGGARVVIIGIPSAFLRGMVDDDKAVTLDGVRGPPLGVMDAHFVIILRADSEAELKGKLPSNVAIGDIHPLKPGIIE